MYNIPKQVFETLGFKKGDKALSKRFAEKKNEDILKLIPSILGAKRKKTPSWTIAFANGLSVEIVNKITSGKFMRKVEKKEPVTPGFIKTSEISSRFGENTLKKVLAKKFPYDNVRKKVEKSKRKRLYMLSDVIMANLFENEYVKLTSVEGFSSLEPNKQLKFRYRVKKIGVVEETMPRVVKKTELPKIEPVMTGIEIRAGRSGRKTHDKIHI